MKSFIIALIMTIASTTHAATFECNSENLRLTGIISARYLRMGHSVFSGDLTLYTYDHQALTETRTIRVSYGDMQDEQSISTSMAQDQFGNEVNFHISQGQSSVLQIGSQSISFVPLCKFTEDASAPPIGNHHNGH